MLDYTGCNILRDEEIDQDHSSRFQQALPAASVRVCWLSGIRRSRTTLGTNIWEFLQTWTDLDQVPEKLVYSTMIFQSISDSARSWIVHKGGQRPSPWKRFANYLGKQSALNATHSRLLVLGEEQGTGSKAKEENTTLTIAQHVELLSLETQLVKT